MKKPKYKSIKLKNFDDFVTKVTKTHPCAHWVYRGVTDAKKHLLIAKLGRLDRYTKAQDDEEKLCWERLFIRESYDSNNPYGIEYGNEFMAAVSAQHHGAPTRLLDWSRSPLVAALFATRPVVDDHGKLCSPKSDAAIYGAHVCPDDSSRERKNFDAPFACDAVGTYLVDPPNTKPRVIAQQSVFTISPDATKSLEGQKSSLVTSVRKYIVPKNMVSEFQKKLYRLGIRVGSLFPESDGQNGAMLGELAIRDLLQHDCTE